LASLLTLLLLLLLLRPPLCHVLLEDVLLLQEVHLLRILWCGRPSHGCHPTTTLLLLLLLLPGLQLRGRDTLYGDELHELLPHQLTEQSLHGLAGTSNKPAHSTSSSSTSSSSTSSSSLHYQTRAPQTCPLTTTNPPPQLLNSNNGILAACRPLPHTQTSTTSPSATRQTGAAHSSWLI
jgi:hypothetical protein